LRPLCVIKNDACGCDTKKTIRLSQQTAGKITIDWDENYILLLNKRKTIKKLRKINDVTAAVKLTDTVKLDGMKNGFPSFNGFVVRQIHAHKVTIINRQTGEKLKTLERRKYNLHCKGLKSGAGGKEYSDPVKKYVIVRQRFWII
jgi:hypothetical protein